MTRSKASRYMVSSFGPELLATLLKGARERVEIPCPDQRTMQNLQMRLQMLRGAMQREKHPNYALVTRARTTRTWDADVGPNANCVLVVQPNDSQFADIITKAGIHVTQNDADLLSDTSDAPLDPDTGPDPYAKFKGEA